MQARASHHREEGQGGREDHHCESCPEEAEENILPSPFPLRPSRLPPAPLARQRSGRTSREGQEAGRAKEERLHPLPGLHLLLLLLLVVLLLVLLVGQGTRTSQLDRGRAPR
jgi:hypothetical protein